MRTLAGRCLQGLTILAVFLAGIEGMARLDDWMQQGVSPLATPDRLHDLMLTESWGNRGKPNGVFRKWHLNSAGFRGPEVSNQAALGATRVLVLGASESFGMYEAPGKEYPAQLKELLRTKGSYEVINAAIAGASVKSIIPYWDHWASRFHPHLVLIYPSPLFYLNVEPPVDNGRLEIGEPGFRPRAWERVKDAYRSLPGWVRSVRRDWRIRKLTAGKAPDWFFPKIPEDRLALFQQDLTTLVEHIRRQGALPILVTHASSAALPLRSEDQDHLQNMRVDMYRAMPETLQAFEQAANRCILALAREQDIRVVDAEKALGGRRAWFADLVHFNDEGAARMAELLAQHVASED